MYRRQFQEDLEKKVRDKWSKVRDKRSKVIEEEGTFKRREVGVAKVIEHSISNDIRIMPNKNNQNFFPHKPSSFKRNRLSSATISQGSRAVKYQRSSEDLC
jgi:hypothetical protein